MRHVHHFRALTFDGWLALTKWRCSCGLSTRSRKVAKALEGRAS